MRRSTFWKGWRLEPPVRPRFLSGGHPGPGSQFSKQPATDGDTGRLETSWVRMQSPRGKREFGVAEVCLPPSCDVQRGRDTRPGHVPMPPGGRRVCAPRTGAQNVVSGTEPCSRPVCLFRHKERELAAGDEAAGSPGRAGLRPRCHLGWPAAAPKVILSFR